MGINGNQWLDWDFGADTDYRKDLAASFGANRTDLDEGTGRFCNAWVDLTYRPSNALKPTLSPSYS